MSLFSLSRPYDLNSRADSILTLGASSLNFSELDVAGRPLCSVLLHLIGKDSTKDIFMIALLAL